MDLDAIMVMGYIAFCSLEVNGTFLSCGIVDKCLATTESINEFKRSVTRHGMYNTLVRHAMAIAKLKGLQVYTASEKGRHLGNNRGCAGIPIVGKISVPDSIRQGTQEEKVFHKKVFEALDGECALIEKELIGACKDLCKRVHDLVPKPKERNSVPSNGDDDLSLLAKTFLKQVELISGKGVGPTFALNFLQVASMFGFIPQRMMTWSTIQHKASGGYKFVKELYKAEGSMTTSKANEYFCESIDIIQQIYGNCVTPYLIENLLCELWRKRGEKVTAKRDCFFGYKFRESSLNPSGCQNLYRVVRCTPNTVHLEMCTPQKLLNKKLKKKVTVMEVGKSGVTANSLIGWDNLGVGPGVRNQSKLVIHSDLDSYLDKPNHIEE